MVFSGRNTRSTRNDLIDVRFFPAPLAAALPEPPFELRQHTAVNKRHYTDSIQWCRVGLTYRILRIITNPCKLWSQVWNDYDTRLRAGYYKELTCQLVRHQILSNIMEQPRLSDSVIESTIEYYQNKRELRDVINTNFMNLEVKAADWQRIIAALNLPTDMHTWTSP